MITAEDIIGLARKSMDNSHVLDFVSSVVGAAEILATAVRDEERARCEGIVNSHFPSGELDEDAQIIVDQIRSGKAGGTHAPQGKAE